MKKKMCNLILKLLGWKIVGGLAKDKKSILAGAPHTSGHDMFICWLAYSALGGTPSFLIKSDYFFFPVGNVLRWMGGIPVNRKSGGGTIKSAVRAFETSDEFQLALTPEGTRKATKRWKHGYHSIASHANVPVYLSYFDFRKKEVCFNIPFSLTEDAKADTLRMQETYYKMGVTAKYPDQFITGFEK